MTTTRTRRWIGRSVVLVAALAAMLAVAAPAHALGTPGAVESRVYCLPGVIYVNPFVSVDDGYFNGQYVSYRYHLTSSRGHNATSGWSGAVLAPHTTSSFGQAETYGTSGLPQARILATTGTIWEVQVQVARWDGFSYAYSGWYSTPTYTNYPRSSSSACRT